MEQASKRRKLSPADTPSTSDNTGHHSHARRPYSHGLEELRNRYIPKQRVDEVHVHVRNHVPEQPGQGHRYYRRQTIVGTASSSTSTTAAASTSSSASLSVSVDLSASASVDLSADSGISSTTADQSASQTSTEIDTSATSTADSASNSSSTSPSSAPTLSGQASDTVAASSNSGSNSSSGSTLVGTGSSALSSTTPSTSGTAVTTSSPSPSTSASNGSIPANTSNGTTAVSSSHASMAATNGSSISTPFPTASRGSNATTSALVISGSSTTYTSLTTFNRSSIGSYTDYSSTITTLSDGALSTVPEAREALVTTLSNGDYSTSYGSFFAYTTTASSSATSSTATSTESDSLSSSATAGASATSSDGAVPAGGYASGTQTASASATSTSAASGGGNASTPPASVLAGGIVGGVAGLAVLLLVAMVFMRWYRRRAANMQPLTESEAARSGGDASAPPRPGMATRAGIAPVLAPLLGGGVFKSRRDAEIGPPATGERGFQRVSGRKLPSAFSDGIEGISSSPSGVAAPPPGMVPAAFAPGRSLSGHSFYRDSTGFHGGEGDGPFADEQDFDSGEMVSPKPGPARQPTLHGPYTALSPTSATTDSVPPSPSWPPNQDTLSPMEGRFGSPTGTAGRSGTPATMSSFEGSRGSRFTEEV